MVRTNVGLISLKNCSAPQTLSLNFRSRYREQYTEKRKGLSSTKTQLNWAKIVSFLPVEKFWTCSEFHDWLQQNGDFLTSWVLQWWHLPTRFNPTQLVSWVGRCDNAFRLFRRIGPVLAYVIEVPAINFAKIHKLILIDILLTKIDYTQTDTTEYIIIRRLTVSGR